MWVGKKRGIVVKSHPGGVVMVEFELIHEIQNLCPNNQMRDVFFREVSCADPESYVRRHFAGKIIRELTVEPGPRGEVTIHTLVDGMMEKFVFSPI